MSALKVTKVAQFKGHQDAIYAMDVHPVDRTIYSAGADGKLVKWQWPLTTDGNHLAQLPSTAYSIKVRTDGRIYLGTSAGEMLIVDEANGTLLKRMALHEKGLYDILFVLDTVLTLGGDGMLAVMDLDGNGVRKYKISDKSLRKGIIDKDVLWLGGSDQLLRKFDLATLTQILELDGHRSSVFDFILHDQNLFSTGRDASIRKWKLGLETSQLKSVAAHQYTVHSLAMNSEYNVLASASMDKTVRLWDSNLQILKEVNSDKNGGHTNSVNKVLWVDSNHFISCGDDKAIMLFHVDFG